MENKTYIDFDELIKLREIVGEWSEYNLDEESLKMVDKIRGLLYLLTNKYYII